MATTKKAVKAAPAPATMAGYTPSPADLKREADYRASSDVRTLHQAHQIKKDPARHSAAKAKMKAHMAALKSLMSTKGGDKEDAADAAGPDSEMPAL